MPRHLPLGLVMPLAAIAGAAVAVAHGSRAAVEGARPAASPVGLPIFFKGSFADPRWQGSIDLVLTEDGGSVTGVDGIAPGPCVDRDFGRLVPGTDGATGPVVEGFATAPINPDGSFALSQRHPGQRRPYKPASSLEVSGTFSGATVRGRLVASTSTPYDTCRADVPFTARRALH